MTPTPEPSKEARGHVKPCPICAVELVERGDYNNEAGWNWLQHPEESNCLLADIHLKINWHGESADITQWNTRATPPEITAFLNEASKVDPAIQTLGDVEIVLGRLFAKATPPAPTVEPGVIAREAFAHALARRGIVHPLAVEDPEGFDARETLNQIYLLHEELFGKSAIDKARAGEGWLPIESAPKDGTRIDLWMRSRFIDCYWGKPEHHCGEYGDYCDSCPTRDDWCCEHDPMPGYLCGPEGIFSGKPTHWRPLPNPPGGAGEES